MILFNVENAMLQPLLTARAVLAHTFQLPIDYVTCEWQQKDGKLTILAFVAPPPDARTTCPESVFWTLTQREREIVIGETMQAAKADLHERLEDLGVA